MCKDQQKNILTSYHFYQEFHKVASILVLGIPAQLLNYGSGLFICSINKVLIADLIYICNSYTTNTSTLPDIYIQARELYDLQKVATKFEFSTD